MEPDVLFQAEFLRRVATAVAWADMHATMSDPECCLRTPALRPAVAVREYRHGLLTSGARVVAGIARERALLVEQDLAHISAAAEWRGRGRILLYQPDASFKDGLVNDLTSGFFDDVDAPPWDTWLWWSTSGSVSFFPPGGCSEGLLASWVPSLFIDLAQEGIEAHPYGGLQWADQSSCEFARRIMAALSP